MRRCPSLRCLAIGLLLCLLVSSLALFWRSGDLLGQQQPPATLVIREGETVQDPAYGTVDRNTGKTGRLQISGKDASLQLSVGLMVGDRASGQIVVENGGSLSNRARADLGNSEGAYGRVHIIGNGSRWTTPTGIEIGARGRGELLVADGGYLSNGARADVGNHKDAFGEVTISGKGSRWVTDWGIEVGRSGQGRLTVLDGGYLRNGARFDIAAHATGQGEVTVRGPHSLWESDFGVTVGRAGRGLLAVRSGGRVAVRQIEVGPAGQLTGDGTVEARVTNAGLVDPVEALTVKGAFEQAESGTLRTRLEGRGKETLAHRLVVDGTAKLKGTVEVLPQEGYTPRKADTFLLLQAASVEGRFDHMKLPQLRDGLSLQIRYAPDAVKLVVVEGP
jgi:T5SS/PEP-CTERM-associated repeat protein